MTMYCTIPNQGLNFYTGIINTSLHPPLYFLAPLQRKNGPSIVTNNIEDKLHRYPQEIYWHAVSVHINESSLKVIKDTMIEISREEGKSRYSMELSKNHVMRCFKQQNGITYWQKSLLYRSGNHKSYSVIQKRETKKMVSEDKTLVCFLDKYQFYTTG